MSMIVSDRPVSRVEGGGQPPSTSAPVGLILIAAVVLPLVLAFCLATMSETRVTAARTGGVPGRAARDGPISPPPQVLYRGNAARSSTTTRAPASAAARAAEDPAGPAPTTATSYPSTGRP